MSLRNGSKRSIKLQVEARHLVPMAVASVSVFAILGIVLLMRSYATTYNVSSEAESGIRSGNYGAGSSAGASGGASVLFGKATTSAGVGLNDPVKAEIAMELVSSAENSSLKWSDQFSYIEWNVEGVASENRGYTAGIVGFCSGTGDMIMVMQRYKELQPTNGLNQYMAAVQKQTDLGMGRVTQEGLGTAFINAWKAAATDSKFQQAQIDIRNQLYLNPAIQYGASDALGTLGQFIYFDALVVHGDGNDGFGGIRANALKKAKPPAQGGNEATYLNAFLDARVVAMQSEEAHSDVTRIENAQRVFLRNNNLDLSPPLTWSVYGDPYSIAANPTPYMPK